MYRINECGIFDQFAAAPHKHDYCQASELNFWYTRRYQSDMHPPKVGSFYRSLLISPSCNKVVASSIEPKKTYKLEKCVEKSIKRTLFIARPANYLRHRHQHCCFRASAHFSSFFGQRVEKFIFVFRCGWCLPHHITNLWWMAFEFLSHTIKIRKSFFGSWGRQTGSSQSFFSCISLMFLQFFLPKKKKCSHYFRLECQAQNSIFGVWSRSGESTAGHLESLLLFYYFASSDSNKAEIYMTHRLVHRARARARWIIYDIWKNRNTKSHLPDCRRLSSSFTSRQFPLQSDLWA